MGEVVLAEHRGLREPGGRQAPAREVREGPIGDEADADRSAQPCRAHEPAHRAGDRPRADRHGAHLPSSWSGSWAARLGAEKKARGALPVAEAIGYVVQVLAGLEVGHAMGIIHRGHSSLDNIFLCDGTKGAPRAVKVLDFGVAKILDVAAEVARPALPHLVTEEGGIVGTPRVIAPEQVLRDAGGRADRRLRDRAPALRAHRGARPVRAHHGRHRADEGQRDRAAGPSVGVHAPPHPRPRSMLPCSARSRSAPRIASSLRRRSPNELRLIATALAISGLAIHVTPEPLPAWGHAHGRWPRRG